MREITHRQMRNDSAEILRFVAAGEVIVVTNHGRPAAVLSPPRGDVVAQLVDQGQMREAVRPASDLTGIKRRRSSKSTAEIVDDVRSRW